MIGSGFYLNIYLVIHNAAGNAARLKAAALKLFNLNLMENQGFRPGDRDKLIEPTDKKLLKRISLLFYDYRGVFFVFGELLAAGDPENGKSGVCKKFLKAPGADPYADIGGMINNLVVFLHPGLI